MKPLLLQPSPEVEALAHNTIGAAIEVHRQIGPGYVEAVYERAMRIELELRGIPFREQVPFAIEYKGRSIATARLDLLIDDQLVVELKSVESMSPVHRAQVLSYLRASGCQLGLLINFNVEVVKQGIRRVIWNE